MYYNDFVYSDVYMLIIVIGMCVHMGTFCEYGSDVNLFSVIRFRDTSPVEGFFFLHTRGITT